MRSIFLIVVLLGSMQALVAGAEPAHRPGLRVGDRIVAIEGAVQRDFSRITLIANVAGVADVENRPVLPRASTMAGVVIILILGMFLAAAVIGPVVRVNLSEELPSTHSHDEPPGASHHHGASGTH